MAKKMLSENNTIKMTQSLFSFIVATLALLIPFPGRFVYGFTLILELNFIMILGTLSGSLIKLLKLEEMGTTLYLFFNVAVTILFRNILMLFQAEVALTLGFLIYVPAVSLFVVGYIFENANEPLLTALKKNERYVIIFSIFSFLYFLFRDVVGYGTFTFYGKNGQIFEKLIISKDFIGFSAFFASIPGAFVLSAIIVYLLIVIRNKYKIIDNAAMHNPSDVIVTASNKKEEAAK